MGPAESGQSQVIKKKAPKTGEFYISHPLPNLAVLTAKPKRRDKASPGKEKANASSREELERP